MQHGESCLDKKHYKCACTEDASPDNSRNDKSGDPGLISMANDANIDLRYSNKAGFKHGLLFPIAATTNPSPKKLVSSGKTTNTLL